MAGGPPQQFVRSTNQGDNYHMSIHKRYRNKQIMSWNITGIKDTGWMIKWSKKHWRSSSYQEWTISTWRNCMNNRFGTKDFFLEIHGCSHQWFSIDTRRIGRGERHTVCKPQEKSNNIGGNEEYHPIPRRRLHQSVVTDSKKNKAVHKSMWEIKIKTNQQPSYWITSKIILQSRLENLRCWTRFIPWNGGG